jgi:iron-sulfur cluster assembly protein
MCEFDNLKMYPRFQIIKSPYFQIFKLKIMLFVAESAKTQIDAIKDKEHLTEQHFVRVSVVSGGCSGLSYKMDFDNESKPNDQVFEDNGVKVVTDLKSFLYLFNTTLEFSGGLEGKGFYFNNPNAARSCGCGESFAV